MHGERIELDIRTTNIWRTARRRRATYLAAVIDDSKDDSRHAMARKLAIPAMLASGVLAVAAWALA